MNELQNLRNLRESVPSSDESLTALRHDLLREIRGRAPRRSFRIPRPAWRLAVAGALAVSLLAVGTIVQRGADSTSPVAILERAAAAVEIRGSGQLSNQPERPRDDQWIYQRTLWDLKRGSAYGMDRFLLPEGAPGELEDWLRFDGKGWWEGKDGKATEAPLKPDITLGGNQAYVWDRWQTLPRDPQALLEEAYRVIDGGKIGLMQTDWFAPHPDVFRDPRKRDQAAMAAIAQVLAMGRGLTAPQEVQATLYRALALIPGLEVVQDVKDAAGRDAIAVTVTVTSTAKVIILLDPSTYDYLGWGSRLDDGKVTEGILLLEAKVVDKPGER